MKGADDREEFELLRLTLPLLMLLGLAAPTPAAEPVDVFQRVNVMVAHHDNRFTLRVWPDGQAEMRFPPYATRSGHYRWQLAPDDQAELEASFSLLSELALDGLPARMSRQRAETLTEVADADWLRLSYQQAGRAPVELMIESPHAWHRALPEVPELRRLAELEAEIFTWMQRRAAEMQR